MVGCNGTTQWAESPNKFKKLHGENSDFDAWPRRELVKNDLKIYQGLNTLSKPN
jgi:hypothetical protein